MKKIKIFIACDTTNISKVKKIISQTENNKLKIGYKFGIEFLNSKNGRKFISKLKNNICLIIPSLIKVILRMIMILIKISSTSTKKN